MSTLNAVACMITYNPDSQLQDRIALLTAQFDFTVLIDNASNLENINMLDSIAKNDKIEVILLSKNIGLAAAYNYGARWAFKKGYQWVVFFDQDTTIRPCYRVEIEKVLFSAPPNLAVLGCNYDRVLEDRICHGYPLAASGEIFRFVPVVISSGAWHHLGAWKKLCGFREDFFIDHIDHEYCLRAQSQGWRIGLHPQVLLEHGVGNVSVIRRLGYPFTTSNYPPYRVYFRWRNLMMLLREYITLNPRWCLSELAGTMIPLLQIMCFESQKKEKLLAALKGISDGWRKISKFKTQYLPYNFT